MRGMAPSVVSFLGNQPFNGMKRAMMRMEIESLATPSYLQDSQQSVTVVLFRDQHTLISSGAVDG